ncbi:MAG: hypothetical protein ACTJHT_06770 [Sphingobacterium sp.]
MKRNVSAEQEALLRTAIGALSSNPSNTFLINVASSARGMIVFVPSRTKMRLNHF